MSEEQISSSIQIIEFNELQATETKIKELLKSERYQFDKFPKKIPLSSLIEILQEIWEEELFS